MFLFLDITALLWLLLLFGVTFVVIYLLLFPLFHFGLRTDATRAIRYAWTAGLWGLCLALIFNSPRHAIYLEFWTGEWVAILNLLCLVLLFGILLLLLWNTAPQVRR